MWRIGSTEKPFPQTLETKDDDMTFKGWKLTKDNDAFDCALTEIDEV